MRFWAIACPPVAVLMSRKPFQAIIALLLTLLAWIPGAIYAWGIVDDYKADKRMKKFAKTMKKEKRKQYKREKRDMKRQSYN